MDAVRTNYISNGFIPISDGTYGKKFSTQYLTYSAYLPRAVFITSLPIVTTSRSEDLQYDFLGGIVFFNSAVEEVSIRGLCTHLKPR